MLGKARLCARLRVAWHGHGGSHHLSNTESTCSLTNCGLIKKETCSRSKFGAALPKNVPDCYAASLIKE